MTTTLKQGTRVRANGYEGTIVRLYNVDPVIYEIRLPGGVCATGDFEIIGTPEPEPSFHAHCQTIHVYGNCPEDKHTTA